MVEQEEFEKFRADFKEKYGIEIDFKSFKKIKADEKRARDIQEEAEEFGMPAISAEESNAKCHNCSSGLSYAEHLLYGNRCVFCADQKRNINLLVFLARAFADWLIYRESLRILRLKGPDGRMYLLGCLGSVGYIDVNHAKKVSAKIALLRELKTIR